MGELKAAGLGDCFDVMVEIKRVKKDSQDFGLNEKFWFHQTR